MSYSSDRLDRIEALLATVAESQARTQQIVEQNAAGLRETRQISDSNAKAIEAWSSRIEEGIAEAEEVSTAMSANTNRRMEDAIADTVQLMGNLANQHEQDRQRFDQLHAEQSQRFNNLLEDARADRMESRQRFNEQLAAMQQDREANTAEHRAFTQNIQVLLAEIARLWQRVAG
jgi:uncharacterized phage infection (PIP) family protein YhgE